MAEQNSSDVVNQTQSGGDLSPSDVPASTPDNLSVRGDGGDVQNFDSNSRQTAMDNIKAQEKQGSNNIATSTRNSPSLGNTNTETLGTSTETSTHTQRFETNGVGTTGHAVGSGLSSSNIGDGSGGSDTDASRAESRTTNDGAHTRASSTKRPASFKPVSFAKFSVTKAPGATTSSKTTVDKVPFSSSTSSTPSPLQSSRPRLVAKTGSGLRDSTPRAPGSGNRSGSTPDPNMVWNKNRPVQPLPSKHLTDEELKQQYGIHMTSRIQSDSNEKEAKWADIDDDEDDWAPETIEWNDGTKITLGQTDNVASPSQGADDMKSQAEPNAASQSQSKSTSREGPKLNAPKPISSLGPNATVLKLGAHMEKQQAKQIGDGSKYSGDRPTLTAKGVLPPSKSPWAPLPPVEKVSPIPVNPPLSTQRPSRFFQGDRPASETIPPSSPTKEIAADDFNRSWRDNTSAAPRELFNSQSGRYEPVQDSRRGLPKPDRSNRNDPHFKPSSLLQRPNHNEQSGPAEPSHAFQTHRSAADSNSWGRRRTSSNVSGGSGIMGRRMSFSKTDHSLKGRNGPFQQVDPSSNGFLEQPTSPRSFHQPKFSQRASSPSRQPPGAALNRGPNNNHYTPPASHAALAQPVIDAPNAEAAPEVEDPVVLQQRIMREKREIARQRRLEEEAREEAAKQERIRLKLQSMGVPPEKPTSKETAKRSTDVLPKSPPKPPVPEPTGEPKQYGMMKVHHPESVKKMVASTDRMPEKPHASAQQSRQATSPREGKFATNELEPAVNGTKTSESSPNLPSQAAGVPQTEDGNLQWKYGAASGPPYSSWPNVKVHAQPPGALWGPPSNDKALGNGTFDRNLTSFPPQDLSARATLGLSEKGPILPAPTQNERREVPDGLTQPLQGAPRGVADSPPSISPLPSPERHPARLNANDHPKPIARPGPIAPPSQVQGQQRRQQDQVPYRSQETTAWNNFHAVASKTEADENERFHRDLKALREEEVRSGISPSLQVAFNETWRQVEVGDQVGQRNVVAVTKSLDKDSQASQLRQLDSTVPGLSFADAHKPIAPSTRGSRFFPTASEQKRPSSREAVPNRSPSPPPPEEISSHPAFTREFQRPLVHLPNPKPRVKLPPQNRSPSPPARQQPVTFASMVASPPPPRVPAKPIANTPSWQDRFNGLFGKKPAQPQQANKNSLAVTSATKEPLDTLYHASSAAVSLPQNKKARIPIDAGKVTSKEVEEEEEIFEDREAGSLPVVKVPIMAPKAAWQPAPSPSTSRFRTKYQRPVQAHSVEPFFVGYVERDSSSGDVVIIVRPPGRASFKKVPLPKKSERIEKGGSASSRQHRTSNLKHKRNTKSGEAPGSHRDSRLRKGSAISNNRTGSPKSQQNSSK